MKGGLTAEKADYLRNNMHMLKYFKNPPLELVDLLFDHPWDYTYFVNPPDEFTEYALKQHPSIIKFVENQKEEWCNYVISLGINFVLGIDSVEYMSKHRVELILKAIGNESYPTILAHIDKVCNGPFNEEEREMKDVDQETT